VALSIEASRGDWRSSVAAIEGAIVAEPNPHFRLVIRMLHVWLLGRFGVPGSARLEAVLEAFEPDIEAAGCGRCQWESVLHGAEAAARLGKLELAVPLLERWDAAQPRPRPGPAARRAYAAALVAAWLDPEGSLPLFDRAAGLAEAAGHDLMRLWIDLDRAVAVARVDRGRAVIALQGVVRDAEAMGAASERQLAIRELRAMGVRMWRRGRTAEAGELTGREREIAELVAAGATNPEIAQTLFLSRKTVERHVSNILARLGSRNRAELAARLAREEARPARSDGGTARLKDEGVAR
jgi:DNA-binding CsgD family transcriptional regulator